MEITQQELENELARFERDTNHMRNGKALKLTAKCAAGVLARYINRKLAAQQGAKVNERNEQI